MDKGASKGIMPALQMLEKASEEMPVWAIAILSLLGRGMDVNDQSLSKEINTWLEYCRLGQVDYVGEPYDHIEILAASVVLPDEYQIKRKVYAGDVVLINTKSALLLLRIHYGDRPEAELKRLTEQLCGSLEVAVNDDIDSGVETKESPKSQKQQVAIESAVNADAPKLKQQEDEVLRIVRDELDLDPLNLPYREPGKRGVKAEVRAHLKIPNKLFQSECVFKKAWERLRGSGQLQGGEP
jgi:hypothetical protein